MRSRFLRARLAGAALTLAALLGLAAATPRAELRVLAAASLTDAFTELGSRFERRHPDVRVRIEFAGSQQLATRIGQGAPADLFAAADERWMADAVERGAASGTPVTFARNALCVIVPASNPARLRDVRELARSGVKLVTGADAVPVGRYARLAVQRLAHLPGYPPDYAERVRANVVSEEENVKGVVGKVQLGEADAGFVYRSDVTPAVARHVRVLAIPESANVIASYPIVVLAGSAQPEAARAFVAFVRSAQGVQVLRRAGFLPAAP